MRFTYSGSSALILTGPSNGKLVFAHFMVGVVSTYALKDWEHDMTLAKSYGIDGFGLNVGKDPYTDAQLALAYQAPESLGFRVFLSFDFSSFSISDVQPIADLIMKYVSRTAQFRLSETNSAYVTTFAGDGFDWAAVKAQTGKDIHAAPNWQSSQDTVATSGVQGLFRSQAWTRNAIGSQVDERTGNVVDGEQKVYLEPVSPWFFTHFGKDVPWSKNLVFPGETLWYDRWEEILRHQVDLQYVQIVSWNDYGESHHVGPYDTPHTDDGSCKWAKDMPHDAMLEFAKPYIAAFKTGSPTPIIERDMGILASSDTQECGVRCDRQLWRQARGLGDAP